ncbi:MAG TPA: hypothetical protein PK307_16435 [Spirochaetota bacterium]|nr:hypothetical protein [Spirochaetota bacterium]HOD13612.1 hypothetical protein [Spirochaetota bacterium]HPG51951.1 hypothetical protein [Spirochaetota bacterium]HPN12889.1 hypothetical protein [Spirochaetota bacterium]HQL83788.1 hypothetical protein [Spirochaetota bacterium]
MKQSISKKIETTINIRGSLKRRIVTASYRSGVTCSDIIAAALKRVMKEDEHEMKIGTRVKYQKRRDPSEWETLHVLWLPEDYEYFTDLRKFRKMSVSYVVSYSIKKYLNQILDQNSTDNYLSIFTGYIFIKEIIDKIPSWRLIWGRPPSITRIPHPHLIL